MTRIAETNGQRRRARSSNHAPAGAPKRPDGATAPSARFRRRSIRLRGYDYTQAGAYFVTVCTHRRTCLFGHVRAGRMRLNALGRLVAREWYRSATIRAEITMDAFVVMPNHIHGIVWIERHAFDPVGVEPDEVGAHGRAPLRRSDDHTAVHRPHSPAGDGADQSPAVGDAPRLHRPPRSLGSFIAGFKASVTVKANVMRNTPGTPIWQRNYHERIVRDVAALQRMRAYIRANPQRW